MHVGAIERCALRLDIDTRRAELQLNRFGRFGRNDDIGGRYFRVESGSVLDFHRQLRVEASGSLHSDEFFFFLTVFAGGHHGQRTQQSEGKYAGREQGIEFHKRKTIAFLLQKYALREVSTIP